MTTRYFINIENKAGRYQAEIYDNRHETVHIAENPSLLPEAKGSSRASPISSAQLLNALFQCQESDLQFAYDERGHLEFGQYLFDQIFGNAYKAFERQFYDKSVIRRLEIIKPMPHYRQHGL